MILGVGLGRTSSGKILVDGGSCILTGDYMCALAEERVTRKKYEGGFAKSALACLRSIGASSSDIQKVMYSSCCDTDAGKQAVANEALAEIGIFADAHPVSHHLSHAASAYYCSPFDEAIVLVLDAGGDLLMDGNAREWWRWPREQASYYVGRGESLELIDRDFAAPGAAGFGEVYRCFTKHLGFRSHVHSEKTMALAAYGDPGRYQGLNIFLNNDGEVAETAFRNFHPAHSEEMVMSVLASGGFEAIRRRHPDQPVRQEHADLAYLVQSSLNDALVARVRDLVARTGIRDLCVAGGVGLNCVANGVILDRTSIKRIFVQPAAGDQGQCLGNALLGLPEHHRRYSYNFDPYIGATPDSLPTVKSECEVFKGDLALSLSARLLELGGILAWFEGRSEFGPRALGHRSILGHPGLPAVAERIRDVKGREAFCPFAPSVLDEFSDEVFDGDTACQYMTSACKVRPEWAEQIRNVVHVDGSSRVQSVTRSSNPRYHELLRMFHELTHIPLVLNTSLNRAGEPIIEQPATSWAFVEEKNLDAMFHDGSLIVRPTPISARLLSILLSDRSYGAATRSMAA